VLEFNQCNQHSLLYSIYFSHILETAVTEREFLEQLHELNHKINFVKEQSFREAKSCQDVKDILEKLKIKVGLTSDIDADCVVIFLVVLLR